MMSSPDSLDLALVTAACSEAVCAARWERVDLETRRPDGAHSDLLLARAAELAMSPLGRDQLMSLALERSASGGDAEAALIGIPARPMDRARIAERVFALGPRPSSETDALVALLEQRHAARLGPSARYDLLPESLEQDASLQETLWDHPEVPASDEVRLIMLCSAPKLRSRAGDLSSGWSWRSALGGWFSLISRRGVQ